MKNNSKNGKKKFEFKLKINLWTIVFGFFVLIFILPLIFSYVDLRSTDQKLGISQVLTDIKEERVEKVAVENERLVVTYKDGSTKFAVKETSESFTDLLDKSGIDPTSVNYAAVDQT